MIYTDDQLLALALYDALTPDERLSVMSILEGLASHQEQSDAVREKGMKTDE